MDFDALLAQVRELLQRQGRVSYRALKLRFQLDDESLAALKDELIYAERVARDEDDRVLVWVGEAGTPSAPAAQASPPLPPEPAPAKPHTSDAERRQLTVLFCDLVESTTLAGRLDPEELREVVRAYQDTCAEIIERFDGHIAQYLGDGLLVYFGYPQAHEDDAQRALRTGLGIVDALGRLNARLVSERGIQVAVRVGIHTGLAVVGEMGAGARRESLALGETPNLAARLQGLAAPDTVVISGTTVRLVQGFFECRELGPQTLKGVATPVMVYQIISESGAQSRLEVAGPAGLTPLVGREQEVGLLLERWAQVKEGLGQVVWLSGEAGIGKSRLVQVVKERVAGEPHLRWECRSSPYYQNSAFYPILDLFERTLQFQRDDTPEARLGKLEEALERYGFALPDVVPLVAALLSLPVPDRYPPLALTPQRQRQKTLEVLLAILLGLAGQQPVLFIVEDLHWVDPSTLELLGLLIDQVPTTCILALFTARPEFRPPWDLRAHLTHLTLSRLPLHQAEIMVGQVAGGKALPAEVRQQVVAKTDGVPLFVEELTKMVLESELLWEREDHYELRGPLPSLAIPATLQDSLMARLDRLAMAKEVAQLAATLGRTFPYELLQAVSPLNEATLQQAVARLVEAELLYQRGMPPQATYLFKHALIQEAAYQSLLRSTRQQYHQRIAQVVEARFPELCDTQPELVAQHYTAAGCTEQAVHYWQQAGEKAIQRSANPEAVQHLTKGLELLATLPGTPARAQQELDLQMALGPALMATKGQAAPEVEHVYTQARALCQQVGETPAVIPVLLSLWQFYLNRPQLHTARALGDTLLRLAQQAHDPALAVLAHYALGVAWWWLGALPAARQHLEEGIAHYTPDQRGALVFRIGLHPGVVCRAYAARTLWLLGYPDQALARLHEALALAHELSDPYSLAWARVHAAYVSQYRRDVPAVYEHAEAAVVLATARGFPHWAALGTSLRGWALAMQGQGEAGMAQVRQGLAAHRATGAALTVPFLCTVLADVSAHLGHPADGLQALAEAHTLVEQHEARWLEAEVHRLRGVLLLQQPGTPQAEAEAWLQRALDIARGQEAKSLELRAAMSLARPWQQQGKCQEAHDLLAPVYGWFTEGFDTADLQEAKVLLDELS